MTLTVLSTDGTMLPSTFTVTVPKSGSFKDLIDALSTACSLQDEETLMVAEVWYGVLVFGYVCVANHGWVFCE